MVATAATRWVDGGWGYRVTSRDQLLRTISRISILRRGRIYAWRGQRDGAWELSSALYRLLKRTGSVDEARMRAAEGELVREARKYGLGRELGISNTDANLLATLQHHGVPTRLIDVTSNPMTALWFATQQPRSGRQTSGVLFAIDVTDMPWAETFKHESTTWDAAKRPLAAGYRQLIEQSAAAARPFRLFPALPDERMTAQEGFFIGSAAPTAPRIDAVPDLDLDVNAPPGADALTRLAEGPERGPGRPFALPFLALVIPPKVKNAMRDPLKGTYNRRRRVLFPDVDGFRDAFEHGEVELEPHGR